MKNETTASISRRRLLGAALGTAIAAPTVLTGRAHAQERTLRILQWKHFVPSFNRWFVNDYVKEWSDRNDTKVIVEFAGGGELDSRARAEAAAQRGHDLVQLISPASVYEDDVIDHREIYEECAGLGGKAAEFAVRSTYNPKTGKYFAFLSSFQPAVISYRKDLWDAVRIAPDSWEHVLAGGRRIKLRHGSPVGFSLAPEDNGESTMRAIMYCFGSSEQDASGNPALKSKATLEVLKYVKALYAEAMTKETLGWDASSNNRFMLQGEGCLTLDTISIPRASDSLKLPFAQDLRLGQVPEGPADRLAPAFGFHPQIIWRFADNIEGAKRFLVDYVASFQKAFLASGFQNMPVYPGLVPNLATLVGNDPSANPPDKYALLADVPAHTTNVGHPGHTNGAIGEIWYRGVVPTMCARAASGDLTPDDALDQADQELRRIFKTWKERGKL
jgi:multiple sugar transport system substrate-binding protein